MENATTTKLEGDPFCSLHFSVILKLKVKGNKGLPTPSGGGWEELVCCVKIVKCCMWFVDCVCMGGRASASLTAALFKGERDSSAVGTTQIAVFCKAALAD